MKNRCLVNYIALTLLLSGLPGVSAALDASRKVTQYYHQVWGAREGMPHNSVLAIHQSTDRYLWIGTTDGLVQFDGSEFTLYNKRNTFGVVKSAVRALLEDRNKTLWIGTDGEGIVLFKNGTFSPLRLNSGNETILSFLESRDGSIWVGTQGNGLFRYHNGQWTQFTKQNGMVSDVVFSILEDHEGKLWVGTGSGLDVFSQGRFIRHFSRQDGLSDDVIRALMEDRKGKIWIGTRNGGLNRFADGQFTSYKTKDGLPADFVRTIHEDREGNLWIGTAGGGIARFFSELPIQTVAYGGQLHNWKFESFGKEQGLSSDIVSTIYQDRDLNLWIGTIDGGLNLLRDSKFLPITVKEGLTNNFITTVLEDRNGSMWFGTAGGGLNQLKNSEVHSFTTADGLTSDNILSLFEDHDGSLWVGTNGAGLNLLRNGVISKYRKSDGLSGETILSIFRDSAGVLWLGTLGEGLNRMQNNKIDVITTRNGLSHDVVRYIYEDTAGRMWVGTDGGLTVFEKGKSRIYKTEDGLSDNRIRSIYEDAQGRIWIATAGGLSLWQNGSFHSFHAEDGLFTESIQNVMEDDFGRLWFSTERGIFHVKKEDLLKVRTRGAKSVVSTAYSRADGMLSGECNGGSQPAGWKSRSGELWFPTVQGVLAIDSKHIKVMTTPPVLKLKSILYDHQLKTANSNFVFPPGSGNLEINYTGITFVAPEKLQFWYKLDGLDDDWVAAGSRRTAYFTNLKPGKYKFLLRATNSDGFTSETPVPLQFRIEPHFYQTTYFRGSLIFLSALLLYAGYRWRIRRLKARERKLMALVAARTQELEEANELLRKLSYLDPLTAVPNRRHFEEVLEVEWKRATRDNSPVSIIMIDIDCFKQLNDTYGHLTGDDCLKKVARALAAEMIRAGDLLARYGGEEFVVLLPNTEELGAAAVAERLRSSIESLRIPNERSRVTSTVTISLGVATVFPELGSLYKNLIASADDALYQAKESGRNRFIIFHAA